MSIEKLEVTNSQGNLLTLSLEDISEGYIVQDMDGLGPVKATIASSNFANIDGEEEQASSRDPRNITIELGYAPDYTENETVRSLRSRLYQFFTAPSRVKLTFYMLDGTVVQTMGTVESCDPAIFTQEPQMNIAIYCANPDFIETTVTHREDFFTTDTESRLVRITGTLKTGLSSLSFTANQAMSGFSIYHVTPGGDQRNMLINAPLQLGDTVTMCTIKGRKSITLTRNNNTSSLLWAVSPESLWVLLEPGDNQLYLNGDTINGARVYIDYYNRHGGL